MGDLTSNQKLFQRWQQLDDEFQPWKAFYKDASKYIWPVGGSWLEEEPNSKAVVHDGMLSDAGEYSNKVCAAGYVSGLCSPSRKWFRLGHQDKDLVEYPPVKEWLKYAEDVMYSVYNKSNWYLAAHAGFEEQGPFGTEVMLMEEHPTEIVRFYPFTVGEYRLSTSWDRRVNAVYRQFWMTADQMLRRFGEDKVSTKVKSAHRTRPYSWWKVMHVIEPRMDRDPRKIDALNMPWASIWVEPGENEKCLHKGGYRDFRAIAARWATRGQSPYGFGPGHAALGRTKMLQEYEKTGVSGLHQMVRPSMVMDSSFKGVLDLTPGAVNEGNTDKQAVRRAFEINLPLGDLEMRIDKTEDRVARAFYNDLFLMITQMTSASNIELATQVIELKEEKMLMLGPSVERQIKEKLEPSIDFVFETCMNRGLLPPPPDELVQRGGEIEVEFISALAQAQRLQTAQGMRAYMAEVERVAQLNPKSTVKTDLFEYLEEYGGIIGVPPKVIRPQGDVEQELAAIAEAEAQQAQMEQAMAATQAAGNLGSARTDNGSALAELVDNQGI